MSHDFQPLRITAVRRETADALSLALAVPAHLTASYAYKPGQHLVLRTALGGEEVRRTYSICSGPGDDHLWITIKRVEGGLFSPYAHTALKVGDSVEAMPPAGRFVLPPSTGAPRHLVAIAAGSGITPVMAMARHALETEPDTRFTLIYGNRALDSIIFREALEDLKDRFMQRLMLVHVLSRDADADVPELTGRIDAAKIERFMHTLIEPGEVDHFFLCGPDTLIKDARAKLTQLGVPRERIHFEFFRAGPEGSEPRRPALPRSAVVGSSAEGADVTVIVDGARHSFKLPEGAHVVDAALAAGIRVPYSCKGGMCCTCRARLVEGKAEMSRNFSLEPWEVEAGFILTCQAQARSDRLVLDYDQV
ncbi:MAG: 2Fe-2S iron-sulfur cluster-binding protein [Hyphomicrobiaceae bacterium]|nr:2Fe-2S iron-sulfur cluster-binding protein [Hyphomicrobiaceae bacterium]